jgi:hypothetical protein
VLLGLCGALLQLGLVALDTLSYQLSQQITFTDVYLQQYPLMQQVLAPLLDLGARMVPEIASPRAPATLGPWFGPLTVAWVVACGAAALGYLGALWVLSKSVDPGRGGGILVVAFTVMFVMTTFAAPGLLSQDIFGYLMYGQVAAVHGLNPYIWPPSAFAHDALLGWVTPMWRSLPSPYGPVWTDVNWLVARIVRDWSIVEQVLAYKVLATGLLAVTLLLLWWLLGRLRGEASSPPGRLVAFTAFAWNPLVLIETAGNGHNDALVLTLLLAGLVPLAGRGTGPAQQPLRIMTAVALFVLSGLVKYLSAIVIPLFVVVVLRRYAGRARRVRWLVAIAACGTLLASALFAPWLELPDSLDPILRQTGGNLYANAIPDLVSLTVADHVLYAAGLSLASARETTRLAMKVLVDLAFVLYLLWELRRLWTPAVEQHQGNTSITQFVGASARATLVIIMVVSIWVQPWYFILPLGLAVLLGIGDTTARVAIGYTLTGLTALYVHYYLQDAAPGFIYLVYAGLPLLAAWAPALNGRYPALIGCRRNWARFAVGLVDERGQTLIANAARRPAVAEVDPRPTNDGAPNC